MVITGLYQKCGTVGQLFYVFHFFDTVFRVKNLGGIYKKNSRYSSLLAIFDIFGPRATLQQEVYFD